jgi:hypothetical protein
LSPLFCFLKNKKNKKGFCFILCHLAATMFLWASMIIKGWEDEE